MSRPPAPPLRAQVIFMVAFALAWYAVLLGGPLIAHYLKGH